MTQLFGRSLFIKYYSKNEQKYSQRENEAKTRFIGFDGADAGPIDDMDGDNGPDNNLQD